MSTRLAMTRELEQLHSQADLERYRAVDVERRKWEDWEARSSYVK